MTSARRSGFTLVEMTIAAALLGLLFGVLGQFMGRWETARRAVDERQFALAALENILEQAALKDLDSTARLAAENALKDRLASPRLTIDFAPPDDLGLVKVTAAISWQNAQGQRTGDVTLAIWKRASGSREEESP